MAAAFVWTPEFTTELFESLAAFPDMENPDWRLLVLDDIRQRLGSRATLSVRAYSDSHDHLLQIVHACQAHEDPALAVSALVDTIAMLRPHAGALARLQDCKATVNAAPEEAPEPNAARRDPGNMPLCLVVRADGAAVAAAKIINDVAHSQGLRPQVHFDYGKTGYLAIAGLARKVQTSIAIIVIGKISPDTLQAVAGSRPTILIDADRTVPENNISNVFHLEYCTEQDVFRDAFTAALSDLLAETRVALQSMASAMARAGAPIPADLFDLPVEVRDSQGCVLAEGVLAPESALFPHWFIDAESRLISVTGLPGSGKSVLLARYAQWLYQERFAGADSQSVPVMPVVLYPQDLYDILETAPDGNLDASHLMREISSLVDRSVPARPFAVSGITFAMRAAGRLFLIIDGLDEFGSRNRGALISLLQALRAIAISGTGVYVACRSNFWDEQVSAQLPVDRRVMLKPLGPDEAHRLLIEFPLPPAAREGTTGEIAEWLRSPLLIRFLRQLRTEGDEPSLLAAVKSRTAVYDAWSQWVTVEASRKGLHENFTALCEQVALEFVRRKRFELDPGVVLDYLNYPTSHKNYATTLAQLDALEVFERSATGTDIVNPAALSAVAAMAQPSSPGTAHQSGKGIRFQHETILEFFAIKALSADFLDALDPKLGAMNFAELRLANVMLDHFQSSVYGFVDEMLEPVNYRKRLVSRLGSVELGEVPELLLRNLIEYMGLTTRKQDAPIVSQALCAIVENASLTPLLRYTAARALERAHPAAPHPYFEYVSDWGTTDFSVFVNRQILDGDDGPWVMRGWRAQEAACRRYLTFGPNDPAMIGNSDLQLDISARLIGTLEALAVRGSHALQPIRINVSLALVRWYHEACRERWSRLCDTYRVTGIEDETIENLTRWVMRWR